MPLGNTLAESPAMIMFTVTLDIQQNISKHIQSRIFDFRTLDFLMNLQIN